MFNHSTILILIALVAVVRASTDTSNVYICTEPPAKADGLSGFLLIPKNITKCSYSTHPENLVFVIKTDSLGLRSGDTIEIGNSFELEKPQIFAPPFDKPGYIYYYGKDPQITFNFNKSTDSDMIVEFYQNTTIFPINGDVNGQVTITPSINTVNSIATTLNIKKTTSDYVHLEIFNTINSNIDAKHLLIKENDMSLALNFVNNQTVSIKNSIALANCSGTYSLSTNETHEITGPLSVARRYQCVNLYNTTSSHLDAKFENFLDIVDLDDKLTLDDGLGRIDVVKSNAASYIDQTVSFKGKNLMVVYDSPRKVKPSPNIQFHLTVASIETGGVVDTPQTLTFPTGGQIRYTLVPKNDQQFAALQFPSNFKLQDTDITILRDNHVMAKFTNGHILPPVVAMNEAGSKMILQVSGRSFAKLKDAIKFDSLAASCHKIVSEQTGVFSLNGPLGPCYWIWTSTNNVGLMVNYHDLAQTGCLTIKSSTIDKPVYSKCNLSQSDSLPTFVLNQGYLNVTMVSNDTRFEALVSPYPKVAQTQLKPTATVEMVSQKYPNSYAWSSESQTFTLNSTKKNYLLSFVDVDLRAGEKLTVGKVVVESANRTFVADDLVLSNSTYNITVSRSPITNDFNDHRGFKLVAKQYEHILMADIKKDNFTLPKNSTNVLLKISAPGATTAKVPEFGKRISFAVLSNSNRSFDFDLYAYDGRSVQAHTLVDKDTKVVLSYNGTTTSDTLWLVLNANKPNKTLSDLVINYNTHSCNKTIDHFCDNYTRCVPSQLLCKGVSYCDDGSDLRVTCSSGPMPQPRIIETGVAGMTVFVLCVLMLILGAVSALYGPDFFKTLETRFRSGQYTTFSSTE